MPAEREALFDLAVARADAYARRARVPLAPDPDGVARALEVWHLRTRFAARIPLASIAAALATRPPGAGWVWRGGAGGSWRREAPARPGHEADPPG